VIPNAYLQEWTQVAPWPDSAQVEQDLIICRALCDIFSDPRLAGKIAFRGGTAIHKLLFPQASRYSEDIDLIQLEPGPIGPIIDGIRAALGWLGTCKREPATHSMHLTFRFAPEADPATKRKLKVEVNTREHQNFLGVRNYPFQVENSWFAAKAEIVSFEPEELFGTKLRALLQRRKNRDLFDLNEGLTRLALDQEKVIACFEHYLELEGTSISRAAAEQRMLERLDRSLIEDVAPLLPVGVTFSDAEAMAAVGRVWFQLVARMKGEPWKLSGQVIEQIRSVRSPAFLR